ncbi:MAG: hypothetical protein LBT46_04410 [Planctomycetaceae bacterium]|jgi:hypothetical protein|nr:hypothetical protein [Planctomycetaceae bacterium]
MHRYLIASVLAAVLLPFATAASFDPANEQLQADWLFQAGNDLKPETVAAEIRYAKESAARLKAKFPELNFSKELAELDTLAKETGDVKAAYIKVREVKRSIVFKNPLINFDRILLIDNPYPHGKPGDATDEWGHEARHRNGYMAEEGGRIITVGLHPGSEVKDVLPDYKGSYWRPDVSFDGKEILFSYRPIGEKSFHLYRMNSDGSNVRQLTKGDYDDLDPVFAPDGKILFCSSRQHSYVRCMPMTHSFALSRCDGDGKNIYVISANGEPEYLPSIMNDGTVGFTRWEYTDKALWRVQSLWTANPDGTNQKILWGNQSVWPDVLTEVRAIPGSNKVMFTAVGHHAWFNGSIGTIDQSKGLDYPNGLSRITRDAAWPEVGNGPADPAPEYDYHDAGQFFAYKTPYPLSDEYFLVSAREGGHLYSGPHNNWYFRLYLMDVYGNKELIFRGNYNAYHAVPLTARPVPPVRSDNVEWPVIGSGVKPKAGTLVNPNVFDGLDPKFAEQLKKEAKALRVIQMDPKTYTTWHKTVQHDGPAVGVTQAEGVKRILGTTPIESDGSVAFEIPPGEAVYFELLDGEGRAVHVMRTFTYVMPGEVRGCFGCHEGTSLTGMGKTAGASQGKAFARKDYKLTPPAWGAEESISFARFVQPVLDKHCAKCHDDPENKAYQKLNMTSRPSLHGWQSQPFTRNDISPFTEPYLTLVTGGRGRTGWGGENAGTMPRDERGVPKNLAGIFIVEGFGGNEEISLQTLPPYSAFSPKSTLIRNAMSGEHGNGVKVTGEDLQRLIAWVDVNGPYLGDEEIRNDMYDPDSSTVRTIPPIRPRVATAPKINRFNLRQDGDTKAMLPELKMMPNRPEKRDPNAALVKYRQETMLKEMGLEKEKGVKVEIVSAFYGKDEQNRTDVTDKLKSVFIDSRYIPLDNYNGVFSDTFPDVVKSLWVKYKINGVTKEQQFPENARIILAK